jgi:hypothetical protein
MSKMNKMNSTTQSKLLLDLLTDPASADLSNRELARRYNVNHDFVAGFRAALKWLPARDAPTVGGTVAATPTAAALAKAVPSSGTRSTPGHTIPFEPPALNSWDCWVRSTERERTKFVDAVGLHHLYAAAPEDHRQACIWRFQMAQSPEVNDATGPAGTADDLDGIPPFLRRDPARAAAAANAGSEGEAAAGAGVQRRSTEQRN